MGGAKHLQKFWQYSVQISPKNCSNYPHWQNERLFISGPILRFLAIKLPTHVTPGDLQSKTRATWNELKKSKHKMYQTLTLSSSVVSSASCTVALFSAAFPWSDLPWFGICLSWFSANLCWCSMCLCSMCLYWGSAGLFWIPNESNRSCNGFPIGCKVSAYPCPVRSLAFYGKERTIIKPILVARNGWN